jgi:hypothetical protein
MVVISIILPDITSPDLYFNHLLITDINIIETDMAIRGIIIIDATCITVINTGTIDLIREATNIDKYICSTSNIAFI